MRLSSDESKVLQALLQSYRTDAKWPSFGGLHRRLALQLDGELGDVVSSLLRKVGQPEVRFEWGDLVRLPPGPS